MVNGIAVQSTDETNKLMKFLLGRISASTRRMREGQVTYLIGNNGTGKSRILGGLANQLNKTQPARTVACISSSIYDRFKFTNSGRIRYLGARNVSNAVFHSAIDRQLSRLILQAMLIDRRRFQWLCKELQMKFFFSLGKNIEKQVMDRLETSSEPTKTRGKAKTHKDLALPRSILMLRRIIAKEQFELLTDAQMRVFLRYLDLNIDIVLNVRLADGSDIGFNDLSTGEQNRALLFAKVLSAMEEGAVFLIDEPEISLHLHWQMQFHSTLMSLLSGLKRFHVVIATHAPILISEAAKFDKNVQRNVVAVLRRQLNEGETPNGHGPGSSRINYNTHTFAEVASHEQLVLQYFQTAPYHAREVSVQIADAVLRVAENAKAFQSEAENILLDIQSAIGLSDETKAQIESALELIKEGLVPSIQRELLSPTKEQV